MGQLSHIPVWEEETQEVGQAPPSQDPQKEAERLAKLPLEERLGFLLALPIDDAAKILIHFPKNVYAETLSEFIARHPRMVEEREAKAALTPWIIASGSAILYDLFVGPAIWKEMYRYEPLAGGIHAVLAAVTAFFGWRVVLMPGTPGYLKVMGGISSTIMTLSVVGTLIDLVSRRAPLVPEGFLPRSAAPLRRFFAG